jgi:hypothetical protein
MSYSVSTLLTRNLHEVFGENDPARRRGAVDEIYTEDCVFYDPTKGVYRGRDEIDRVAGAIRATHPDFLYKPIAAPEELGNGGRSNGCRAAQVRRQLTPGLISSLPGTAVLPPFISFSTSYPELESAVRRPMRRIGNGEKYLVVAGVPRFQAAAHREDQRHSATMTFGAAPPGRSRNSPFLSAGECHVRANPPLRTAYM